MRNTNDLIIPDLFKQCFVIIVIIQRSLVGLSCLVMLKHSLINFNFFFQGKVNILLMEKKILSSNTTIMLSFLNETLMEMSNKREKYFYIHLLLYSFNS